MDFIRIKPKSSQIVKKVEKKSDPIGLIQSSSVGLTFFCYESLKRLIKIVIILDTEYLRRSNIKIQREGWQLRNKGLFRYVTEH